MAESAFSFLEDVTAFQQLGVQNRNPCIIFGKVFYFRLLYERLGDIIATALVKSARVYQVGGSAGATRGFQCSPRCRWNLARYRNNPGSGQN